jgi:hypothetical protein
MSLWKSTIGQDTIERNSQRIQRLEELLKIVAAYALQDNWPLIVVSLSLDAVACGEREHRRKDLGRALEVVARDIEEAVFDLCAR